MARAAQLAGREVYPVREDSSSPAMTKPSASKLAAWVCLAEVLSMAGFSTYPALLPLLQAEWGLSNAAAGFVAGALFAGYVAAVPLLSSLTDRHDARDVYVLSCVLSALGCAGFAVFADGVASAALWQVVVGAGLAGTFMPGLRMLTDRLDDPAARHRYGGYYTASFAIGMSGSLALAGFLAAATGWRAAFGLAALGPLAAGIGVWMFMPARTPAAVVGRTGYGGQLRSLLRNRAALAFIVGYAAHCWEVFAVRAWMVAFLAFSASVQPFAPRPPWSEATIAAAITLLAWPAAVAGNEAGLRFGYRRVAIAIVAMSALMACGVGFLGPLPWWVVVACLGVYFAATMADTSVLTVGVLAATPPEFRGTTLGVHSAAGFLAGFAAPFAFGVVLDVAGGNGSVLAWGLAFAALGTGLAAAPIMAALMRRGTVGAP
jgi:MFS family permease